MRLVLDCGLLRLIGLIVHSPIIWRRGDDAHVGIHQGLHTHQPTTKASRAQLVKLVRGEAATSRYVLMRYPASCLGLLIPLSSYCSW